MPDVSVGNVVTVAVLLFAAGGAWVRAEMLGKRNKEAIVDLKDIDSEQWTFITDIKSCLARLDKNVALLTQSIDNNRKLMEETQRQFVEHQSAENKFIQRAGERLEGVEKEIVHLATLMEKAN